MFHFLGGGWGEAIVGAQAVDSSSLSTVKTRSKVVATGTAAVTPAPPGVVPTAPSSPRDDEDKEDAMAKDMLVQFPVYGTRSQAQHNNLNPTADWLLGGTPNIPSQQQLLLKQQQQQLMQQLMQQEEENAAQDEKQVKTHVSTEPVYMIRNWDDDERLLWKSVVPPALEQHKRHNSSLLAKEVTPHINENGNNETKPRTTSMTPQFEDLSKDWIYAYYYHTGVTPKIETTRPHPIFDRGPTNGLRKSLPRSAFSGYDSIKALNDRVPGLVQDELEWYDDYDGSIPHDGSPASTRMGSLGDESAIPQPRLEDRQHWMPDRLCKHCYACDTAFTVFRRRHHCRICGQVFCNNCSGFFLPATPDQHADIAAKTILRACKMCFEQVSEKRLMEEEDDVRKRRKNNETTTATTTTATTPGSGPGPGASPVQQHPTVGPSSPLLQQSLNSQEDSVLTSLSKRQSAHQQKLLSSQEEAIERDEREQATIIMHSMSEQEKVEIHQETRGLGSPDRAFHERIVRLDSKDHSGGRGAPNRTTAVEEGNRHLGLTAATHLEEMGKALLASDAPLLYSEICEQTKEPSKMYDKWLEQLMILATRCCATVEPNVKRGDLLDIRPYVKIKVIPGGTIKDCAYVSGVLFSKTVSHKRMAREIINPSIMLLSGGIEFTRTENRIASLETLMEQESKYIEILVGKILKVKPDILMVGRAVSRRAQELLLDANVTLVQHVKTSLLARISRQTGATIISSTDHIMNQFGAHVLGRCNRFRVAVARDNEVWVDHDVPRFTADGSKLANPSTRDISKLLNDAELTNAERQSVLAANMLGQGIQEGHEAIKAGLAKRGVAQTYVMLEGCPKDRGCTVVLRGLSRKALKQVKIVFRFLVNAAYNLRLETSFLKERCARLHPEYDVKPQNIFSSSLCVDYGQPPSNRKIRPWNGGSSNEASQRSISGHITAFDHQSILISSVWMTDKSQCCPAEVKGIHYYSQQDVSLGQFLRDSCFNLSLKCKGACRKSVLDHSLSFVHNDGLINITVDHMDDPLPPAPPSASSPSHTNDDDGEETEDPPIATWTYCKNCSKVVTPLVFISENTWKYSFGKFLECFFYNRQLVMNSPQSECKCSLRECTLYFGCGRLAARFTYEPVRPFGVFVRKCLPVEVSFHRNAALRELEQISMASSLLFVKFDKHIERVSRESRSLFSSSAHRPEYVQTVLSELNRISSEVDHAAATMSEKIASVTHKCSKDDGIDVSDALLRFPWFARRYLFMLTSAWNEKLSAAGQAIVAMKKMTSSSGQRGDSLVGPNVPTINGDQNEELLEGIRRLKQLHEVYSRYNVTDISTVLPIIPGGNDAKDIEYDDDFEDPDTTIDFADGVDADVLASRRRLYQSTLPAVEAAKMPTKSLGTRRGESESTALTSKVTPGGAVKSALNRFFNRGGRGEYDPYVVDLGMFSEGRPRLEPGVNGIVIPVFDEQLCTVIAYSLSSQEYANQFQGYSKLEGYGLETPAGASLDPPGGAPEPAVATGEPADSQATRIQPLHPAGAPGQNDKPGIERRMLVRNKTHIKHTFRDFDEKGQNLCKFVCTTYWATQFQAVREAFLSPNGVKGAESHSSHGDGLDIEQAYVQSLSSAFNWAASGGKSGASFARTADDRFVLKCISRTELQMFLESAPAYFEYLSKAFFHGLPTVLCKIVGVYQIGYHNRLTGKRSMEQVAVMQNIFYHKKISRTFDLKGSLRGRFAAQIQRAKDESSVDTPSRGSDGYSSERKHVRLHGSDLDDEFESNHHNEGLRASYKKESGTLLDGDFLEFTAGRPMPMNDRAKAVFHMSILNDTLFLSIINVLDYSILVGVDEERKELVVGIIDFMRQYDILKQMERVGKSLPMVVGSEAPTIIQPPLYKARFTNAMERYFMTVPSKWTTI